jgi:uncharacterized protein YjbJ (UPF0337 family)
LSDCTSPLAPRAQSGREALPAGSASLSLAAARCATRNPSRIPLFKPGEGNFTRGQKTMNWDRIEGNWKQLKGRAQQKWGKLTDDDINVIEGNRTELSGRLQNRYGIAKDEAERQIDTWMKSIG